jgi:hypothetical protein
MGYPRAETAIFISYAISVFKAAIRPVAFGGKSSDKPPDNKHTADATQHSRRLCHETELRP